MEVKTFIAVDAGNHLIDEPIIATADTRQALEDELGKLAYMGNMILHIFERKDIVDYRVEHQPVVSIKSKGIPS